MSFNKINSVKKLFKIDERITRLEYLLFGVLTPILLFIIINNFKTLWIVPLLPIIVWIAIITAIKRGRDAGLNSIVTFILFITIPTIILYYHLYVDFLRNNYFLYLSLSFILYLLLIPTSKIEIKKMNKWESKFLKFFSLIFTLAFTWSLIAPTCILEVRPLSNKKISMARIYMIETALDSFKLDNKTYPSTQEGLKALIKNPNQKKYPNFDGPYLPKVPKDGWDSEFIYTKEGEGFKIVSYGADKKEGGEGENEDMVSLIVDE